MNLRPSSADRWSVCTASPALEENYPSTASTYANEGTEAHAILEKAIKSRTRPPDDHPTVLAYDHVAPFLHGLCGSVVMSEVRLEWEGIKGTADLVVYNQDTGVMEVVDYKHGAGVLVEADSLQLAIYAAGALKILSGILSSPFEVIRTTIVQPRASHPDGPVRSVDRKLHELIDVLRPVEVAMKKIEEGGVEFSPGEKQCRFCRAKADCKALADQALEKARGYFTPENCIEVPSVTECQTLTIDQKLAVFESRDMIRDWISAIEQDIQSRILSGDKVDGYKVVAGRSNRKWGKDDAEIIGALTKEYGLKLGDIAPPKLIGPAPIEKLLKKSGRELDTFASLVVKPEGAPTVVRDNDPRPAINPAFIPVADSSILD